LALIVKRLTLSTCVLTEMGAAISGVIKQHLIDPEICIRCNTCEATCPVGAITHDSRNYVVDAEKCNLCMDCVSPCPTGSIDHWHMVPKAKAYSLEEQLSWDDLPAPISAEELAASGADAESGGALAADSSEGANAATALKGNSLAASTGTSASALGSSEPNAGVNHAPAVISNQLGSVKAPWSAAHPYAQLYGPKAPEKYILATVTGNHRVTEVGTEYDTHHLVLDFGQQPFPVLEGQSIAVIPPGQDANGRAHHARQYSLASPRNGERSGYNNLSLTIKRVLEDHQGQPVRGVASNYLCDLKVGDTVQVIGPFGTSFLMPNHPRSNIVMICTGTGSAPMRAMTEWRRRLRVSEKFEGGKLMLFFGARSKAELPYFGPLQSLPKDFIDINFAYSRAEGEPKTYVQDLMRQRAADLIKHLKDPNSYFFVCGLKSMEEGVLLALRDITTNAGASWPDISAALKRDGRLHLETY
jgi:benzoyl-CoA 2,3-epoxidase subunit A